VIKSSASLFALTALLLGGCSGDGGNESITPSEETSQTAEEASDQAMAETPVVDAFAYCEQFGVQLTEYPKFFQSSEFDPEQYETMRNYVDELWLLAPDEIIPATEAYAVPVDAFTAAIESGSGSVQISAEEFGGWQEASIEILGWCVNDVGYTKQP